MTALSWGQFSYISCQFVCLLLSWLENKFLRLSANIYFNNNKNTFCYSFFGFVESLARNHERIKNKFDFSSHPGTKISKGFSEFPFLAPSSPHGRGNNLLMRKANINQHACMEIMGANIYPMSSRASCRAY